ncbi:MAG: hypothetical protein D6678_07785 [Zetaproteobacteria bacterium]|nr:MAG: hypothetical protein D6678_07785 [Zetaproteobacteria bacterium]
MSVMFLPLRLIPVPVQCVVMSTVLGLVFSRESRLKPLLRELDGKVFRIQVRDTGAVMFLGFDKGRVWVHPQHDGTTDVRINGTLEGFARMCFAHEDPDDLVFAQQLKLSGDSEAMLRFKKLLAEADLDWERELRAAFGDFFGSRVASAAKALVAMEQKLGKQSHQLVSNYLRDIDLPDQQRLQTWQAGVEQLAHKTSHLKGRITRIEHRLEALEQSKRGART